MTKTEKTFSTRSNAKRAIASFRDKNPDLIGVGVSVFRASDKFTVHATGWENAHVAAIDAAGFIRVESEEAAPAVSDAEGPALDERALERAAAQLPNAKKAKAAKPALTPAGERAMKASLTKAVKAAKPGTGERGPTKTDLGLDMLRRKKGVTVAEMGEAFGWLPHTTRAWISATASKKLGNAIETEVVEGRGRVYRIAS
jgi:Protein of unknown function (DUF3489)